VPAFWYFVIAGRLDLLLIADLLAWNLTSAVLTGKSLEELKTDRASDLLCLVPLTMDAILSKSRLFSLSIAYLRSKMVVIFKMDYLPSSI
jgi:hypothetical protein